MLQLQSVTVIGFTRVGGRQVSGPRLGNGGGGEIGARVGCAVGTGRTTLCGGSSEGIVSGSTATSRWTAGLAAGVAGGTIRARGAGGTTSTSATITPRGARIPKRTGERCHRSG